MSMRVLHVINTAEVGGGGEHLWYLVRGLRDIGIESSVVVGRDGPLSRRLRDAGVPLAIVGPMGARTVLALRRVISSRRPDVLHLHGSRAGLLGTIARVGWRMPTVYTAHAFAFYRTDWRGLGWLATAAERVTCRFADRLICLNRGDVAAAAARKVRTDHAMVIPNGVDLMPFAEEVDRRRLGLPVDAPMVGMVARFVKQKDPLAFVAMAQQVTERVPEARFVLVGDGPMRAAVEAAVRKAGLTERVILPGFRTDVPQWLMAMDVVVLTSRWEGLPLTVLETMAAGRPVVATALPGVAEVLRDGETGVLVPAGDAAAMAAAVVDLLRNPSRRTVMGLTARREVEHRFTSKAMIQSTAVLYRNLLASRAVPFPQTT